MTTKSIIGIEVNDQDFKRFHQLFQKYQEQLKKTGVDWNKVQAGVSLTGDAFSGIIAALLTWSEMQKKLVRDERKQADESHKIEVSWGRIARFTKTASTNVFDTLKTLARWTSAGALVSGLLGGGGLFGLDRLGQSVGATRRSALGLGVSYGTQRAFGLNYGRVVNPDNFLSGVNEALTDVTKRSTLYGGGLGEGELRGKDAGQVSIALLEKLKTLADRTPQNLLGQVLQARGLGQFVSLEDFQRLRNTPRGELQGYAKQFNLDRQTLNLQQDTQKRWQDFAVQLTRAGEKIENVFVRGLDKLVDPLTKLSDAFADTLKAFLEGPELQKWVEELGEGIKSTSDYLSSQNFRDNVKSFVTDIATLASGLHWIISHVPGLKSFETAGAAAVGFGIAGPPGAAIGAGLGSMGSLIDNKAPGGREPVLGLSSYGSVSALARRNPMNIRVPGSATRFQSFRSEEDSIRAGAALLRRYQDVYHLNTIRQIEGRYSPPSENDTHFLIKQLAKNTGFGADQPLDLSKSDVLAKIVAGIAKQEGAGKRFPTEVVIKILNTTGGSAIVSAAAAAH